MYGEENQKSQGAKKKEKALVIFQIGCFEKLFRILANVV